VIKIIIGVELSPVHEGYGGDAYLVKESPEKVLIAVIDGLGHGVMAHQAAQKAVETLKNMDCDALEEMLEKAHRALSDTVGVVIGLVEVDKKERILTYTGVGNISIRLIGSRDIQMLLPEGILGYRFERRIIKQIPLLSKDLLIMHTDGISPNYELNSIIDEHPQDIAQNLMNGFRSPNDDALVLVATGLLVE
jgi:negative regulator of sigma-B (phosphoserine phosphatase)